MTNNRPFYSYSSQGGKALSSGLLTLGILFLFGIALLFTAKIAGILLGIALITLSGYLLSSMSQRVDFFEGFAMIHYFGFKKPVEVRYDNIWFIQPHTVPRTRERIFIAETRIKKPVKKFTWQCSDKEFEEMKYLLKGNQIKIGRE